MDPRNQALKVTVASCSTRSLGLEGECRVPEGESLGPLPQSQILRGESLGPEGESQNLRGE
jgi:hypothetical protein